MYTLAYSAGFDKAYDPISRHPLNPRGSTVNRRLNQTDGKKGDDIRERDIKPKKKPEARHYSQNETGLRCTFRIVPEQFVNRSEISKSYHSGLNQTIPLNICLQKIEFFIG